MLLLGSAPAGAASAPRISKLSLAGQAQVGATLVARVAAVPRRGRIAYRWQRLRGRRWTTIAGATRPRYRAVRADLHRRLRVQARVRSGRRWSRWRSSRATPPLRAAAPRATVPPQLHLQPSSSSLRTGSWDQPVQLAVRWQRCTGASGPCQDIPGASASDYTLTDADAGHWLRSVVTATNADGAQTSLLTPTVGPIPYPQLLALSAPTLTGSAVEDEPLTGSPGSWNWTLPKVVSHAWQRCPGDSSSCTDIAGAGALAYTLTANDIGSRLRLREHALTPGAEADSFSALSAPVAGATPLATAPPTLAGSTQNGQALTLTPGSWSAPGTPTLSHQWQRCSSSAPSSCAALAGQTGLSYTLDGADVGLRVRVLETASWSGHSASQASALSAVITDNPCHGGSYCSALLQTSGLQHYWRLDGTTRDLVHNLALTVSDQNFLTSTAGATGDGNAGSSVLNTAMSASSIYFSATPSVDFSGTHPWTIELFWREGTTATNPRTTFYGWWNDSPGSTGCSPLAGNLPFCSTFVRSGARQKVIARGSYWASWGGESYFSNGLALPSLTPQWTHLAFTYDGSSVRLYREGVEQVSFASPAALPANPLTTFLASTDASWDELALYDRALSASDLAAHAAAR